MLELVFRKEQLMDKSIRVATPPTDHLSADHHVSTLGASGDPSLHCCLFSFSGGGCLCLKQADPQELHWLALGKSTAQSAQGCSEHVALAAGCFSVHGAGVLISKDLPSTCTIEFLKLQQWFD